ncbi:amino acid ABC transporter ATP-binding/permease protein [Mogibacterium pumilum]|uniref:ABC transporter ATP-binding protein n=1 Tax=Mogibacterium pumilum TaxID=86332 RepID=A0A223ASK7_9FIRM|nr:ABC transporter ATP-binding protein [Mogibacterium pumilum]ASS37947.1 ABC transporter ATP-binding protein [Mogibacterium pumilum]
MNKDKRRSDIEIMRRLIVLVKPLTGIMLTGIILGVVGFLCAIFLTIMGGIGVIKGLSAFGGDVMFGGIALDDSMTWSHIFTILVILAVARGVLHYGEQYCNHYIAFRILAIIRHKVFECLRKLCPAKLEGKNKGDLIAIITGDIELLEVFFAHTISPIVIAFITSLIMVVFIGYQSAAAGLIALAGYIVVGVVIPVWNGKRSAGVGMKFRNGVGELNNFVLDSMYGVDEILQYGQGDEQLRKMNDNSRSLAEDQKNLSSYEGSQRAVTNIVIQLFSWGMLFTMIYLYVESAVTFSEMLIATLAMMSSFGPVVALSSLSNSLNQTLACGERVLSLLEEVPEVEEVSGKEQTVFTGAKVDDITFSYIDEVILKNVSVDVKKGRMLGIHGASGSGKSTLLKLLMRFWDVRKGEIRISEKNIKDINTVDLRNMSSYVTQDTILFRDTIANNIRIAREDADITEIEEAAKKASIHDFIMRLPYAYETNVGELGDTLSDGEKQRVGLARAFLHDADLLLLDEPTSNLDILNEGIILKSLKKEKSGKTMVLVSHRKSTLSLADRVYEMDNGRLS